MLNGQPAHLRREKELPSSQKAEKGISMHLLPLKEPLQVHISGDLTLGLVHLVFMVAPLSEPTAEVKEDAVEAFDSLSALESLFKFGKCVRSSLCTA